MIDLTLYCKCELHHCPKSALDTLHRKLFFLPPTKRCTVLVKSGMSYHTGSHKLCMHLPASDCTHHNRLSPIVKTLHQLPEHIEGSDQISMQRLVSTRLLFANLRPIYPFPSVSINQCMNLKARKSQKRLPNPIHYIT